MYKVESTAYWFITDTTTKRKAYSEGAKEFGRGGVTSVTIASAEDIAYFKNIKGDDAVRGES